MPRFRDVIDHWFIGAVARVNSAACADDHTAGIVRRQERLIARLKAADEKRSAEIVKLRSRLAAEKLERRRARRSEIAERRKKEEAVNEAECVSQATNYFRNLADGNLSRPGCPVPARIDRAVAREQWFHRRMRRFAWKREMRLGVLFQHEPRVLQTERFPRPKLAEDQLPIISIVVPSYQQAEFVERTLRSILDQKYPEMDCVVMDGGSTDGSADIISRYAPQLSHWQSERDGGHTQALATGFAKTRGDIMAWLNSDDTLMPGTLRYVAEYFARHPDVDVIYGHRLLIDERDQQVGRWVLPRHDGDFNKWADYIPQETMFWRRSAYEKAGGMDPSFRFSMDWDLILRLQKTGARFVRLPRFLGCFRVHSAQKSQTQIHTVAVHENALLRAREIGKRFREDRLEARVVQFQCRAAFCDRLLKMGIRW